MKPYRSVRIGLMLLMAVALGGCDSAPYLQNLRVPPETRRASEMLQAGELTDAFAELDRAIKEKPSDPTVYLMAAEVCLRYQQPHRAISYAEKGLQATPGAPARLHAALYSAKGVGLQSLGDLRGALAAHRAALRLAPEEAAFKNNVAYALAELAESEASLQEAEALALDTIETAQKNRVDDATLGVFLDTLGWIQFKRGDLRSALANLTRAADAAPDQPEILYHLGLAYAAQNRSREAIVVLSRAVKMRPSFTEAQRRLEELRGSTDARISSP